MSSPIKNLFLNLFNVSLTGQLHFITSLILYAVCLCSVWLRQFSVKLKLGPSTLNDILTREVDLVSQLINYSCLTVLSRIVWVCVEEEQLVFTWCNVDKNVSCFGVVKQAKEVPNYSGKNQPFLSDDRIWLDLSIYILHGLALLSYFSCFECMPRLNAFKKKKSHSFQLPIAVELNSAAVTLCWQ